MLKIEKITLFIDCHTPFWEKVPAHLYIRAAKEGSHLIIQHGQNKNPADDHNNTPLHWAANEGHLEVCRLIIANVQDKNPADHWGQTPMHLAAGGGHLEICRLIIKNIQDKNPAEDNGNAPLHMAAI